MESKRTESNRKGRQFATRCPLYNSFGDQDRRVYMPSNRTMEMKTELKKYLQGAKFPADKIGLVEHAKQQHAPSSMIDLLEQLPTPEFGSPNAEHLTEYNNIDELIQEIEKIE
jgi:hypothetical protein